MRRPSSIKTPPTPSLSPSNSSTTRSSSSSLSSNQVLSESSSSSPAPMPMSAAQPSPGPEKGREKGLLKRRRRNEGHSIGGETDWVASQHHRAHNASGSNSSTGSVIHSPSPRRAAEDPSSVHHHPSLWDKPRSPVQHVRPQPVRQASFPKRHSSFDTPREVPFAAPPPPSLAAPAATTAPNYYQVTPESSRVAAAPSPSQHHHDLTGSLTTSSNTAKATTIDRASTSSLPLPRPFVEPFHSLPPKQDTQPSATATTSSSSSSYTRPPSLPRSVPTPNYYKSNTASSSSSESHAAPPSPTFSNSSVASAWQRPMSPQIHTPPPLPPNNPFLPSHTAGPDPNAVGVETTDSAYVLQIQLPGFGRDSITLATRKKKTLHVVADRWDNGGGPFLSRNQSHLLS